MKTKHTILVRHFCLVNDHEFTTVHHAATIAGVQGIARDHCEPSYRRDLIVTPEVFAALGGAVHDDGTFWIGDTNVKIER